MKSEIKIAFDPKTRRLVFSVPFHLSDAVRNFPSRRFSPKDKTWRLPIVKANIDYLNQSKHIYDYRVDADADEQIQKFSSATEAPLFIPFPRHVYDFHKANIKYDPMAHQDKMLDRAWNLNAVAWFAKMGTGKTFAAIHLMMARWMCDEIEGVMVICPSNLRYTWKKELEKYATCAYDYRIHETKAPWLKEFYATKSKDTLPILAVSVEGLGVSESLYDSACGFTVRRKILTIVDESSRIKGPERKRTQRTIEIGRNSTYRMILNGTPIALGIQDLWAQYEFLDPNIIGYGDYWAFKTRHIVMGGYENKQMIGVQHVEELMTAIIPYTVEVGKDVLNLPPKMMKTLICQPTKQQKDLFRLIVKGVSADPNAPQIKVDNVLERNLRLQQVIGGWLPRAKVTVKMIEGIETEVITTVLEPLETNPKIDLFMDMIEDNFAGSKFIIWTTFRHEIEFIRDELSAKYGKETVECYYGKTAMEDRSRIEDRYCNDSKMRFFVGNPVAGGLGLTLISGENDVMVYYSGTNAYIIRAQSEDRAHRIGQENTVTIVDLVMEKTLDEVIQASIAAKMDVEEYIMTRIAAGINVEALLLGE